MRIGFVELVLLLFIASITVGPNVALFVDRWLRRAQRTSAAAARRKAQLEAQAAIEREAAKAGLVQNILLEVNIGGEESKSGVSPEQLLLSRGLGFLPGGIVDQHFNRRARLQRLLAAMEDAGENEGFGISEDTALEVSLSDRALRVHGSAYVMHLTRSGGTITIKKLTAAQHAVQ